MPDFGRLVRALRHAGRIPEVLRCATSVEEWRTAATAYIGMSRPNLPTALHMRNGMTFRMEEFYDIETLWQVWFRRVYRVEPGDRTVVDAGANIGLFSAFAASQAPQARIFSVEPFPGTFERLRSCASENGLSDRMNCFCLALAGATGERRMASSGVSENNRMLPPGKTAAETVIVPAQPLDEFLDSQGLDSVDLLKMDIEGSEYEVLGAAGPKTLGRIRRLNLEYHASAIPGQTKQSLIALLADSGLHRTFDTGTGDEYGVAHFSRAK